MIRQYIGARYVTKIYENSLDPSSAEWEAGVTYEPLTLVTYLNSSYLSKKDVPGSVGDPAANPSYWVVTGAYNGQIATLQAQVDAINAELNKPMKVACIGDSYGMKITNNWCNYLKAYLGLDNDHFINKCTGSSGFVGNTGIKTFLQQLQEIADPETYTHIIIVGGFNDGYDANGQSASASALESAINACGTYIKNNFVNAKTYIGFAANICNLNDPIKASTMRSRMITARNAYAWYGAQNGWAFMETLQYILHDTQYLDVSDITYDCVFHPNSIGGNILARAIISYMTGGDFCLSNARSLAISAESGITITGTVIESLINNSLTLGVTQLNVAFATPYSTPATPVKIGTVAHAIVFPGNGTGFPAPELTINAKGTINGNNETTTVTIMFNGNDVSLWLALPAGTPITGINSVAILPASISANILLN